MSKDDIQEWFDQFFSESEPDEDTLSDGTPVKKITASFGIIEGATMDEYENPYEDIWLDEDCPFEADFEDTPEKAKSPESFFPFPPARKVLTAEVKEIMGLIEEYRAKTAKAAEEYAKAIDGLGQIIERQNELICSQFLYIESMEDTAKEKEKELEDKAAEIDKIRARFERFDNNVTEDGDFSNIEV